MSKQFNKHTILKRLRREKGWSDKITISFELYLHKKGWLTNGSIIVPDGFDLSKEINDFEKENSG